MQVLPMSVRLTFDRGSRTLNCTSTGGPATTLTWTKDGAVIYSIVYFCSLMFVSIARLWSLDTLLFDRLNSPDNTEIWLRVYIHIFFILSLCRDGGKKHVPLCATSSPSPQLTSLSIPTHLSSPSSPGTDSTTTSLTCSCMQYRSYHCYCTNTGISGIAITLTVVVIVAVIKRQRTSYRLKELNIRYKSVVLTWSCSTTFPPLSKQKRT